MPTAYEQFQAAAPYKHEVKLDMVADSTVETAVEIDTDIPAGGEIGWNIVGLEYQFCNTSAVYFPVPLGVVGYDAILQLCRGDVPTTPVKLSPFDGDLIVEDVIGREIGDATALGEEFKHLRKVSCMEQTQLPKLYLMFTSQADWAAISDPSVSIYCNILYYPVIAPKAPRESL